MVKTPENHYTEPESADTPARTVHDAEKMAALSEEEQLEVIDLATEPFVNFAREGARLGIDRKILARMVKRFQSTLSPVIGKERTLKTGRLLEVLEDKIARTLDWLDDEVLAKATAKDLAITLGILLEKRALLRGEPTQILAIEERLALNQLIPELVREAKHRGMVIDLNVEEAIIVPGDQAVRQSR